MDWFCVSLSDPFFCLHLSYRVESHATGRIEVDVSVNRRDLALILDYRLSKILESLIDDRVWSLLDSSRLRARAEKQRLILFCFSRLGWRHFTCYWLWWNWSRDRLALMRSSGFSLDHCHRVTTHDSTSDDDADWRHDLFDFHFVG